MPASTGEMYSLGIVPPTILFVEHEPAALLVRHDAQHHVPVLTAATGLADETTLGLLDRLA